MVVIVVVVEVLVVGVGPTVGPGLKCATPFLINNEFRNWAIIVYYMMDGFQLVDLIMTELKDHII